MRKTTMAKSKRVKVIKYSPVFDSQGVEIGHVVENQLLTVASMSGELCAITKPCPWGAFGVMAHVPSDAIEIFNGEETLEPNLIELTSSRHASIESIPESPVVEDAIPSSEPKNDSQ
jgi:hypothetical protein